VVVVVRRSESVTVCDKLNEHKKNYRK
jgi:hypothetical protein